jgi:hypothetical protein
VLFFWLCEAALESKITLLYYSFWVVVIGGVSLFLSLSCGLWLAINRLADFRETASLIRIENKRAYYQQYKPGIDLKELDSQIDRAKSRNNRLGIISWGLLKGQGLLFGVGIILLGIGTIVKVLGY